jgi:hypothetical protein
MQLVKYDAMVKAIAMAYKVDEVKDIRDKAVALEAYAKQAKNTEAERRACEIRLRAERKAGQLLKKMPKAKGGQPSKKNRGPEGSSTLNSKGISKKQSKTWQKLGTIPDEQFEAALDQADKPTTNGIIRATSEPKHPSVATDALWLWGWLRDFERSGMFEKKPAEVMETLTPTMSDFVHTLAPKVAAWLKRIGAAS